MLYFLVTILIWVVAFVMLRGATLIALDCADTCEIRGKRDWVWAGWILMSIVPIVFCVYLIASSGMIMTKNIEDVMLLGTQLLFIEGALAMIYLFKSGK